MTHRGKYRYKVAPQGLSISSDFFLNAIQKIFRELMNEPGFLFEIDDVLLADETLDGLHQKINPFAPNDDFARHWKSSPVARYPGIPGPEDFKNVRHFAVASKLKKLEQF